MLETHKYLFDNYSLALWRRSSPRMDPVAKAVLRRSILRNLGWSGAERPRGATVIRRRLALVGAAAFVAVLAFTAGFFARNSGHEPVTFQVAALRGQQSKLTLPDGTVAWLNSDTRLSYASDYSASKRNVTLEGEAYFEVASDPEHPFVVNVGGTLDVAALGTKFNVKAYPGEETIVATLSEGRVLVRTRSSDLELRPGENAFYSRRNGSLKKSVARDPAHLIPWRENQLLLDGVSLRDLGAVIERMYNVNVIFADEDIQDYTYTGLILNNSMLNILDLVSATSGVRYTIRDNTVTIDKR